MPTFTLPRGSRKRALEFAAEILGSLDELVPWKVTAEPVRNERSLAQNAYLWSVPYKLISEHAGYEKDELHEWFCGQFFGWRDRKVPKTPRNPSGIESAPVRTTTRNERGKRDVIKAQAFSDFVAYIQRFAAQKLQIIVPDPDPDYALHRERAA